METATIITLGNRTTPTPTSFEEAFGEFSEARGRGRARRQKRRMERIENRKTRRKARQEGRLEKKRGRVEARTQRRTMRAENRESRRNMKSEGKRGRERADLEQEREFAPEDAPEGDSGYAPEGESSYEPQSQGGYAEESGYAPQGSYDEGGYAEEQGGYDEGGYYDEGDGFDNESYEFDGADEMIDAPYSPKVNEDVADAAKRIEWNLELASRLKDKQKSNPSPKIAEAINNCKVRVSELNSQLNGYCNFEGDFVSDADGDRRFQRTSDVQVSSNRKRRNASEVRRARRIARAERNAIRKKQGMTPVQDILNPEISENRIEIPAKELGSNATGIIGLDNAMDYDANATEITLGFAGGKTSKIPFKAIAIGVAVGALGIFLLRRYKVI
jgi:hypothetical protein